MAAIGVALLTETFGFSSGFVGYYRKRLIDFRSARQFIVAAATSVFVVIVVVASASFTQISALVAEGGFRAVPWNLVCYTIPAVIVGGQIGPRLQGRGSQHTMVRAVGVLFAVVGLAMAWIVLRDVL